MPPAATKGFNHNLNHVVISVPDCDAALEWYTTVLGFRNLRSTRGMSRKETLDGPIFKIYNGALQEVKTAWLGMGNSVGFEIFVFKDPQYKGKTKPFEGRKFEYNNGGFFHIGITAPDPEVVCERVVKAGGKKVGETVDLYDDDKALSLRGGVNLVDVTSTLMSPCHGITSIGLRNSNWHEMTQTEGGRCFRFGNGGLIDVDFSKYGASVGMVVCDDTKAAVRRARPQLTPIFYQDPFVVIYIFKMPTNYDIGGKVIALTGAASGIGLQTTVLLAAQGAHVSMADVSEAALYEVASKIESAGGKVLATVVDVRDGKQIDAWIQKTVDKFGKLNDAVNLAGDIPKCINVERVEDLNNEDWKFVLNVNLTGVMYCMRAQLQNMNIKGSVVNAASICGVIGFPKNAAYTASKHAIIDLSRAAAKEVGEREIRINCIAPSGLKILNSQVRLPPARSWTLDPPPPRIKASFHVEDLVIYNSLFPFFYFLYCLTMNNKYSSPYTSRQSSPMIPYTSNQSSPMIPPAPGYKVEAEPFISDVSDPGFDDHSVHNQKNVVLKTQIRVLRFIARLAATAIAAATAAQEGQTLYTYLHTRNTIRDRRGPWAKNTSLWPAIVLLSISGITFILGLMIIIAYARSVKAANSISSVSSWLSLIIEVAHILMWIVVAVLYRVGKTGSDLWGWACSPLAQKIQPSFDGVVQFDSNSTWHLAIASASVQVLTFVIFVLMYQRKKVQKQLRDGV
ncbi:hypothetical protein G7Y89_g9629 [Cudoniella acicularis]|uniref:VOC domain-containing protein n=1 Tax=Cudoniella acicularis TaxID=354080 RepID=A0A8H4REA3_9HELO|nr:hypothetical protein G7Y89_g9629 [Cudoniella acicularis]